MHYRSHFGSRPLIVLLSESSMAARLTTVWGYSTVYPVHLLSIEETVNVLSTGYFPKVRIINPHPEVMGCNVLWVRCYPEHVASIEPVPVESLSSMDPDYICPEELCIVLGAKKTYFPDEHPLRIKEDGSLEVVISKDKAPAPKKTVKRLVNIKLPKITEVTDFTKELRVKLFKCLLPPTPTKLEKWSRNKMANKNFEDVKSLSCALCLEARNTLF